jgi:multidrug resistance efflux pump
MAMAAVKIATTRITEAEQALELARLRRSLLKVVAPRDGTVSRLVAREGQVVEAGQVLMQTASPASAAR